MKTLIYSFEKFGMLKTNPAAEIAKQVKEKSKNTELFISSGTFDSWPKLEEKIKKTNTDFIIGIGVSDRPKVSIEYFGLNMLDSSQGDNKGKKVRHSQIDKSAPAALTTTIDVKKILSVFKEQNIPSKISYFPGTHSCNLMYFNCLNYIEKNKLKTKTIFIHVPLSPEEVNRMETEKPSFPIDPIAKAIEKIIS